MNWQFWWSRLTTITGFLIEPLSRARVLVYSWLPRPNSVHLDPEYQAAHEFKDQYIPKESVEYDWVVAYARLILDRFDQADQALDAKAESIMKVLGGGTGLLTLGGIINRPKLDAAVAASLCVALVLALAAIACAAWVRVPRNAFLPPSIGWALAYADYYEKLAEARFMAQWHLACEGARLALRAKVRGVKAATWLAVFALIAVAVSFFLALATMDVESAQQSGASKMSKEASPRVNTPPAPNPSGTSQTPPALQAGPQEIQKSFSAAEPAKTAEPQSIQFSHESISPKQPKQ